MLIESNHQVHDKDGLKKAVEGHKNPPQGTKLVQCIIREGQSHVTCVWEAPSVEQLRSFVESVIGTTAKNSFYKIDESSSVGLNKEETKTDDDANHLHQLGKKLASSNQSQEAMSIFQLNAKLNPDAWFVEAGLARGYAALGNYPAAVKSMKSALNNAPPVMREHVQNLLSRLESQQNIN
jgi:tetratricopeptide (TPR) repeat protein